MDPVTNNQSALLKRALLAIQDLESKLEKTERALKEPIAIVGIGCRFPGGANDPESFWELLRAGHDAVSTVPADRWDRDVLFESHPDGPERMIMPDGAFLDRVDGFDAGFFGMAPREAAAIDPQQRLALEVAVETLENAGVAITRLHRTKTGIFLGVAGNDFSQCFAQAGFPDALMAHYVAGAAHSVAAGRISYVLGLQGPSLAVDTACSSALVSVHLACMSLRAGECNLALAGGVNLMLVPETTALFSRVGMLSPRGRCRTFDEDADGFARGEGCGFIALKRLSLAQSDGDRILAVIRGSAVNQDGPSSSLTAPNGPAQEALIRDALAQAGLTPAEVSYIEAHGTGTALGDPIELHALGNVYGPARPENEPLLVGSLKTNMGHLEAAAGIAGLIKSVLALEHRQIPPHLHLRRPTSRVNWRALRLAVPQELTDWNVGDKSRIAAVSSFGFSGTNAHIILEEAPAQANPAPDSARPIQVLAISAKSSTALGKLVTAYHKLLEHHPEMDLWDICFTANVGRSHFSSRTTFAAPDTKEMLQEIASYSGPAKPHGQKPGRICYLFTGQGSQYVGMGRELYEGSVVFREAVERCSVAWKDQTGESLSEALYVRGDELKDARVIQPALFALEYGLAELWRSWGIEPWLVLGHSLGEYVAAVVSGLLKLEDGLRLVHARAELMDRLEKRGTMRAVMADPERVRRALEGFESEVAIAAINGPASVVISGGVEGVRSVAEKLEGEGIRTRALEVSHGFHSPMLEPILDEFEQRAGMVTYGTARQRIVSNLTGQVAEPGQMSRARYWRDHMRQTVQFHAGLQTALASGCTTFIEIGPQPQLTSLARTSASNLPVLWLPSMRRGRNAWLELLSSLRVLYEGGAEIDWAAVHEKRARKVVLPGYPWEQQSYPLPKRAVAVSTVSAADSFRHPLLGVRLASPLREIQFQSLLSRTRPAWLADHVLRGEPVVPAAGYLEMALSAARRTGMEKAAVESAVVLQPCVFDEPRILQCVVSKNEERATFEISSSSAADPTEWLLHAIGELAVPSQPVVSTSDYQQLASARSRCSRQLPVADFYTNFEQRGLNFGPGFRCLTALHVGTGEAVSEFTVPASAQENGDTFVVHPVALDACLQTVAAAVMSLESGEKAVALPAGLKLLRVVGDCRRLAAAHASVQTGSEGLRAEFHGFDDSGKLVIIAEGLIFRAQTPTQEKPSASAAADFFYEMDWVPLGVDAEPLESAFGDTARWLLLGAAQDTQTLSAMLQRKRIANTQANSSAEGLAEANGATVPVSDFAYVAPSHAPESGWDALKELLQVAQAVASGQPSVFPRFWVVTRGAQGPQLSNPAHASLWGLARSMALEYPEMRVIRLDLDQGTSSAEDWQRAIRAAGVEDEIVVRGEEVYVPRLRRRAPAVSSQADAEDAQVELGILERGALEGLQIVPAERRPPAENELEIEVCAAGLNFRDVLNVLGMYKGKTGSLGGECAGIVARVGAGVSGFNPGDEVISVGSGCFRRYITANPELVWRKPERISFAAAAALPIAFLTASYALNEVARLQPGESVLIHAGAGGVGQAAIQLARAAGAVVFAPAGSDEKRAYLGAMGVNHVMDSRSLDFASEVLKDTGGRGVEVVLNSLTGPFIDAGFRILAPGGRFLELGVADLRSPEWVQGTRPDVRYFPIDLTDNNTVVARVLTGIMQQIRAGTLEPLPHVIYQLDQAQEAFRWMAQARHIGKITLSFQRRGRTVAVRKDGAYLVTGGLSGLGLEVAKWLVERGAGEVVVMGRNAPSQAASEVFDTTEKSGSAVTVRRGDVSIESDVAAAIDTRLPLRGIFHCAGVLEDAVLSRQDWTRFEHVLAGKAEGARHLDRLTWNCPLDHFVLFSSVAGVLGSPGQSNYAAANAFLDALAQQRSIHNLPALSVNWGAWLETGMAVRHGVLDRSAQTGMTGISTRDSLSALQRLMESGAGPQSIVLAMNWNQYFANSVVGWHRRLLSEIEIRSDQRAPAAGGTRGKPESWLEELQATGKLQQRDLLRKLLDERVRATLRLPGEQAIGLDQPLQELGLDSLLSIELRNSVGMSLRRPLPATLLFDYPTLAALTEYLLSAVGARESSPPEESRAKLGRRSALDDIESLSDEEVEKMLSQQTRTGQEVL